MLRQLASPPIPYLWLSELVVRLSFGLGVVETEAGLLINNVEGLGRVGHLRGSRPSRGMGQDVRNLAAKEPAFRILFRVGLHVAVR